MVPYPRYMTRQSDNLRTGKTEFMDEGETRDVVWAVSAETINGAEAGQNVSRSAVCRWRIGVEQIPRLFGVCRRVLPARKSGIQRSGAVGPEQGVRGWRGLPSSRSTWILRFPDNISSHLPVSARFSPQPQSRLILGLQCVEQVAF